MDALSSWLARSNSVIGEESSVPCDRRRDVICRGWDLSGLGRSRGRGNRDPDFAVREPSAAQQQPLSQSSVTSNPGSGSFVIKKVKKNYFCFCSFALLLGAFFRKVRKTLRFLLGLSPTSEAASFVRTGLGVGCVPTAERYVSERKKQGIRWKQIVMRIVSLLFRGGSPPMLGRWCTPAYSKKCDPFRKADLASVDSGDHTVLDLRPCSTPARANARANAGAEDVGDVPLFCPSRFTGETFGR